MRIVHGNGLRIVLIFVSALAVAQEDWSPRYVPTQPSGTTPQQQTATQAPPSAAPSQTPSKPPVKEYSEEEGPAKPAVPSQTAPAAAAPATAPAPAAMTAREKELREIAERFAPVLHKRQAGTAEEHRFDYPTNFDFDGDWVGNNNWQNAADSKYKLWSFVYYSVIEGEDHYYIQYALFHPRDWSVVEKAYTGILDKLQDKYKEIIGEKARKEVEFNHENDLEGALVIVDKWAEGGPAVIAASTVAHNHLLRWVTPEARHLRVTTGERKRLRLEDGRPILYVESQKHGVHAWQGEEGSQAEPILVMRYGKPMEFSQVKNGEATYELVSIYKTWWKYGRETREPNNTFGTVVDFGDGFCTVAGARRPACEMGKIGGAIRGDYARPNASNAPWNWIDLDDKELTPGAWFFDPAYILRRHFGQFDSAEKYLYNPYLGIGSEEPAAASQTAR